MLAEFHPIDVVDAPIEVIEKQDGVQLVQCRDALQPFATRLTDRLESWAEKTPNRIFIGEKVRGSWETLTYQEVLNQVQLIATNLLKYGLSENRPIMILSGNSIDHLLLMLAGMYIGVPVSPISPAYSLISTDYGKLKHASSILTPGLIFTDELEEFEPAIKAINQSQAPIVASNIGASSLTARSFDTFKTGRIDPMIFNARDNVIGSTIAKFLFTSGSTGLPKAVINTQEMICANQEMIRSVFRFMKLEPPTLIDWLPWNHTFGGNHNIGIVLYNGGSLYIDHGKPTPKAIQETIENLKTISPDVYFNVPKGYELVVDALEKDTSLASNFFKNLKMTFFAGAGLSQHVWDRLDQLSIQYTGKKIPMVSGLGATETAPSALFASIKECASGVIGTPCPGVTLKLIPNGDKTEIRVKAVTVTPGYWKNEEQTAAAFDEEGFYCLGDAVKYIDPKDPQRGFLFDGRVSEDFKLNTGTWVSVGALRSKMIEHFAPFIQDIVITGHNEAFIGALIFPNVAECARHADLSPTSADSILKNPAVKELFEKRLQSFATQSTGSSTKVHKLVLLTEPASIDAHEITDKGSINQRAVLAQRASFVNEIYSTKSSSTVISLEGN